MTRPYCAVPGDHVWVNGKDGKVNCVHCPTEVTPIQGIPEGPLEVTAIWINGVAVDVEFPLKLEAGQRVYVRVQAGETVYTGEVLKL